MKRLWNAVHRLIADQLTSNDLSYAMADHRTLQSVLSALHDIGYQFPGSLGQPAALLYQERTRRDTLIWRAA